MTESQDAGPFNCRNFFNARVFVIADSLFEFAPYCGLNPPLDPQAVGLSIEGRAVPDYGAPFNFLQRGRARAPRPTVAPDFLRFPYLSRSYLL
jgi:hypothetical protein